MKVGEVDAELLGSDAVGPTFFAEHGAVAWVAFGFDVWHSGKDLMDSPRRSRANGWEIIECDQAAKQNLTKVQTFSQRLEDAITRSGRSKMDLARHLGVPPSSVSRWVSGTEPRSESVVEIAKFLGVDFAWLMTGAGADLSVVREEETPFRVRKPEEPTLIERMEMLQHGYDETKAELAEANRKLDALMDLLTGRKP